MTTGSGKVGDMKSKILNFSLEQELTGNLYMGHLYQCQMSKNGISPHFGEHFSHFEAVSPVGQLVFGKFGL